MNTAERIAELASKLETNSRKECAEDIIADLADFARTPGNSDLADGLMFAIEIIKENYL